MKELEMKNKSDLVIGFIDSLVFTDGTFLIYDNLM